MSGKTEANAKALLPILVFLIMYLGNGILFEYVIPQEGGMGFYIVSAVLAFSIALIVAFLQNRSVSFDEKIHICAKGIGDDNIVIMLFIFLLAGAFSGIAKEAGGASSMAYMLLSVLPGQFAVPGLFLIACLISMAMGTSVGTITVLAPIARVVALDGKMSLALCIGAVVGGAMFGDNLSFISDTTIAATKTQGVEMKDKFRANLKVALPAAVITFVILIIQAVMGNAVHVDIPTFSIPQALPYLIVLVLAIIGMNVFIVLIVGIVLCIIAGLATGSLTYVTMLSSMGGGTSNMFETMIVTILVASIASLVRENGGFETVLDLIRSRAKGQRGGMAGIAVLTAFMDLATANNTVAIVIAAPIAKDISREFGVDPKTTASLMDTCSCIMQGIIPYGAQILIAAGIAEIAGVTIIPYLIYPFILAVFVLLQIILGKTAK